MFPPSATAGLNLPEDFFSLLACETGLGKLQAGEGLISFVQALLAAGSRSVVASLWSVVESAYPLMVSMYRNLRNRMNKAEALQHAKLGFMKGVSEGSNGRKYANIQPFLWAPFEFYGAP